MKRNPDMQEVVKHMAPGVLSREGFLGADPRLLEEILDADAAEVARLGATHGELARKLEDCLVRAREALGTEVAVDDRLKAVSSEGMGRIACPWGDRGAFQKGEVTLTETKSGETVRFSALSVHMIAEHGFYGGRGSRYRLEPAQLCRIFRSATFG